MYALQFRLRLLPIKIMDFPGPLPKIVLCLLSPRIISPSVIYVVDIDRRISPSNMCQEQVEMTDMSGVEAAVRRDSAGVQENQARVMPNEKN